MDKPEPQTADYLLGPGFLAHLLEEMGEPERARLLRQASAEDQMAAALEFEEQQRILRQLNEEEQE